MDRGLSATSRPTAAASPDRRRSLPTTATASRSHKRSPNLARPQAASPEVISSLIDSLSAISIPAHTYFENFPAVEGTQSTPVSPSITQAPFGGGSEYTGDYGAYRLTLLKEQQMLYADEAAEPPVVRTSKPPSGLSPVTAPKKPKKEKETSSLKTYLRSTSCSSLHSAYSRRSLRSKDDASSLGNISIEAGVPRNSTVSRASTESKQSGRAGKGLMYMSSRERLRSHESKRRRGSLPSGAVEGLGCGLLSLTKDGGGQPPSPRIHYFADAPIDEEPGVAGPSRSVEVPRHAKGISPSGGGAHHSSDNRRATVGGLSHIPERGSSLRRPEGTTRSKGRSRRSGKAKQSTLIGESGAAQEVRPHSTGRIAEEPEEHERVAARIRQLKDRIGAKDKLGLSGPERTDTGATGAGAGAGSMGADMGIGMGKRGVSASEPFPLSTSTSTTSSASDRRQRESAAKAHKILGISSSPMPSPRRHRSLSDPITDDGEAGALDDIPIDYQLAIRSLEQGKGSLDSTRKSHSTGARPSRSNSASLEGRTVKSRSTEHGATRTGQAHSDRGQSATTSPTIGHQSLELPHGTHERQPGSSQPSRRVTLYVPPSSATATAATERRQQKKKRWSHPDLPLKADSKHQPKSDHRTSLTSEPKHSGERDAVKPPAEPVLEERPTSVDSVDDEVEAFLNARRLSQKVQHPQTGRVISFSEVGDPNGFAVFCCVGMGLTRYVMAFYDELALTLKLRLITPDRPGIGQSQADPTGTPLSWPDDVYTICQALRITKFSLLAHSAGAIYALATALRMAPHIRGRVHLLAPWIPPSQMAPLGIHQDAPPGGQLPRSQRLLRALPPSWLKVANSAFLSASSASMTRSVPKTPQKSAKRKGTVKDSPHASPGAAVLGGAASNANGHLRPTVPNARHSMLVMDQVLPNGSALSLAATNPADPNHDAALAAKAALSLAEQERRRAFDERLTFAIWDRATAHANPATDLVVCLETRQRIGFRYEDVGRGVVIHHGSKDSRVPVENVRWLGRVMRRCEVRILEGEQHGLMASAVVMGNVLTEMAKEWEDWTAVTGGGVK